MAQKVTTGSGARAGGERTGEYEVFPEAHVRASSSHLAERFGAGVAAGVLLGAVVGVVAAWALGTGALVAMFVALGAGFVLAPVAGLLALEFGDD